MKNTKELSDRELTALHHMFVALNSMATTRGSAHQFRAINALCDLEKDEDEREVEMAIDAEIEARGLEFSPIL